MNNFSREEKILFIKRPIIWISISYIGGIILGEYIKANMYFSLRTTVMAFSFLILLFFALSLGEKKYYTPLILSLFFLSGIINTNIRPIANQSLDAFLGKNTILHGQIVEKVKIKEEGSSLQTNPAFILELKEAEFQGSKYKAKCKIRVTLFSYGEKEVDKTINKTMGKVMDKTIDLGDWVKISGIIERPQGQRNPKGFNYRDYLANRDIYYTMGTSQMNILDCEPGRLAWPKSWFNSVAQYMDKILDDKVGGRESSLMKAMIIGERWALPSDMTREFRDTGSAHILAISGLHIGFIVIFLTWFFGLLRLSPKIAFFLEVILLGAYCFLVGASPSAVRASLMAIIILGGRVTGRKSDPMNSLFFAALVILLYKPWELKEVGFLLSFFATAGIILFYKPISMKLGSMPKFIKDSLAVIISAQLATWPLMAYFFNLLTPISFVANLLLVPMAGIVVILGLFLFLLSPIILALGQVLGWGLKMICSSIIDINAWMSDFSWANLRVTSPWLIFIVAYYIIFYLLSEERPKRIKKPLLLSGGIVLSLLLLALLNPFLHNKLEVIFVDVGQGDCIHIRTPDGKNILVDGGGRAPDISNFDTGSEIVLPYLLKNGIGKLDLLVMSHLHDDHMGGLGAVAEGVKIDAFMEYPPRQETEQYKRLKSLIEKKKIRVIRAKGGETYKVGKETFLDILYPLEDQEVIDSLYKENENNLSLVVRVRFRDTSLLLTGDMEDGVESYLSQEWEENVSLLKVAHHGSKTSSREEWIDILSPDFAVIQSGKNSFGHPSPDIIKRFENKGVEVFRNDLGGAVICLYKKGQWEINTLVDQ